MGRSPLGMSAISTTGEGRYVYDLPLLCLECKVWLVGSELVIGI
jgi:hypothetical protein